MKLSDSIKYSFLKTIRDKKNIYFIIILIICSTLLLLSITFLDTVYSKINYDIINDIDYRSIYVSPLTEELELHYKEENYDYGFDKILELDHVYEMFDSEYKRTSVISDTFKNNKYTGFLTFKYGSNKLLPDVIYGRKITEEETGVAICPIVFYPSATNDIISIKKDDYLDGLKYLNTEFNIKKKEVAQDNGIIYETDRMYEKNYKIVGLYDNKKYGTFPNECFISAKDQIELYDSTRKEVNKSSIFPKMVIVDNSQNAKFVLNEINNLGFDASIMAWIEQKEIYLINIICISIISLSIGGIVLVLVLYLKKISNNDAHGHGILKALGYQNKLIQVINFGQLFYQIIIAFIFSIIIIYFTSGVLNYFYSGYFIYNNLSIKISLLIYLLVFIGIIIISFITSYFHTKRKMNNNSLQLMKDNISC